MEIKQVEKTKTVTVYIASDGKEYDSWDACNRHEEYMKKHEEFDWLRDHAIATHLSDGLCSYIVRDCPDSDALELLPLMMTDETLEHIKKASCSWVPEAPTGNLCFISIYNDEDAYYEWDVERLIKALADDIKELTNHIR